MKANVKNDTNHTSNFGFGNSVVIGLNTLYEKIGKQGYEKNRDQRSNRKHTERK